MDVPCFLIRTARNVTSEINALVPSLVGHWNDTEDKMTWMSSIYQNALLPDPFGTDSNEQDGEIYGEWRYKIILSARFKILLS
jgi:hypothetical protein